MSLPKDCRDCPVWKKSLFKDSDQELLQWLAKRKKFVQLKRKDVLFDQGQQVDGLYCHMSGLAKVVQKDDSGEVLFSRLVFPGDTSGHRSLFVESDYKGTADVVSNQLQACYISKEDILYLLSHNAAFAKNLVVKISMEGVKSEQAQISARRQSVRGRLAALLCELCEVDSEELDDKRYMLKSNLTKRDIAGFLSVANETVIRLMSEMKSEGIIDNQGKKVLIYDLHRLRELAKL
ncbi:MAG: Crp/Fnr family transcriptional regulator [Gammaproteobacteria bacterium]|jgi:CRP-like cAMP-binding protein